MKVIIETKASDKLRYRTLGDYKIDKKGVLRITVADTGDDLFNELIAIHELLEELLTRHRNIKEEDIYKFDLWVEEEVKAGRYPDDAEPGEHPKSIYRKEHLFAEKIERMVAKELKINWEEYSEHLNKLL